MPKQLMIDDLERSGLTAKDADLLKLKYLTKDKAKDKIGKKLESYLIPYFNINGKIKKEFWRARYIETPKGFNKNKQRYTQPKDSGVHLYLPPSVKWEDIAATTSIDIVITEGEKKAAKACKEGLPTIGLGGVWSFRSKKEGKRVIDDFDGFDWSERSVYLIFDSDLRSNSKVALALTVLADELTRLGAYVFVGFLPDGEEGQKVGLDDYLLTHKVKTLLQDIEVEEYELGRELWAMNEEIAYLHKPVSVYHFPTGQLLNRDKLVGMVYSNRTIVKEVDNKLKFLNAANEWLKWPLRREHNKLVYSPGKEEITEDSDINVWSGWGCEPKKGCTKLWDELIDYLFQSDQDFKKWFLQWLAYPLQHPGEKMYTSVLIHGLTQGTGKSIVGYIMGKIYGENFKQIEQPDLSATYNQWSVRRQFILGEEITGVDGSRRHADMLKSIITRENIFINEKFVPQYEIKDCLNYLLTSQHPDALHIEPTDRRFAIHEAPTEPMPVSFFRELDYWKNNGGPAALFYKLSKLNLKGFHPKDHAPMSDAKESMKLLSFSDLDSFAHSIRENTAFVLRFGDTEIDRDLFTIDEVVALYDKDESRNTTRVAMSKALKRAGFVQTKPTTTDTGTKRLWALRNTPRWRKALHNERRENYEGGMVVLRQKNGEEKFKKPNNKGGK